MSGRGGGGGRPHRSALAAVTPERPSSDDPACIAAISPKNADESTAATQSDSSFQSPYQMGTFAPRKGSIDSMRNKYLIVRLDQLNTRADQ